MTLLRLLLGELRQTCLYYSSITKFWFDQLITHKFPDDLRKRMGFTP